MLGKNGRLFGSNFGFDDDERREALEDAGLDPEDFE